MNLTILCIGKMRDRATQAWIDDYRKRLPYDLIITELDKTINGPPDHVRQAEGEMILGALPAHAAQHKVIVLDERGKNVTSPQFAAWIGDRLTHDRPQSLIFIIGGAHGLSEAVRMRADWVISFGAMTWPHKMVRMMLVEQIYRAHTILSGHPYHKV
jgi:23S rRNA (pseudouridine1915-N3)-methyltransferase